MGENKPERRLRLTLLGRRINIRGLGRGALGGRSGLKNASPVKLAPETVITHVYATYRCITMNIYKHV